MRELTLESIRDAAVVDQLITRKTKDVQFSDLEQTLGQALLLQALGLCTRAFLPASVLQKHAFHGPLTPRSLAAPFQVHPSLQPLTRSVHGPLLLSGYAARVSSPYLRADHWYSA